ncbi:hypothetical protein TSTA_052500 [Talaromyces stipitatus ATCC 10500]|uniref:Uncharacterized protein n=1 Tax=Talaromyces stipitatus (strain ATCC 10500 / CBS 375.48 / QM 6759 / NRRL 1006) TaxID=441959 RepID=B8MQT0_TALSN|nr:uncharacterized protein TSTA_052500 [Talaromyces stipitatus ATCC 10500]EED12727.1 hypothetical protein TSTA_052500 [Talaromyces stipitatus ATCC 10500]
MDSDAPIGGNIPQEQNRQLQAQAKVNKRAQELAFAFQQTRPRATTRLYSKPQAKWGVWCKEQGFSDGELVTENKMVTFLDEWVLHRPIRSSCYKRACTDENGDLVTQTLGVSSLKQYAAGLVDLWKFQKTLGQSYSTAGPDGKIQMSKAKDHRLRNPTFI